MTAPKKRDLVAALEALIPLADGQASQMRLYAKSFDGGAIVIQAQFAENSLNTARALVAEYRKQKGAE